MTSPATNAPVDQGSARGAFVAPGGARRRPFAAPSSGHTSRTASRRRRPGVLDASRTALIPLRPLGPAEILDASFVVLRANAKRMLLLPLIVIGAIIAGTTGTAVAVALMGDRIGPLWVVLIAVLGGMFAIFLLITGATWVSSVLTRASLQTLLGPGFAPALVKFDLVGMIKLLPPVLGLIFVQVVAFYVASSPVGLVGFVLSLPLSSMPESIVPWYSIFMVLVMLLLWCWLMSYFALAVPTYTAENAGTPGWIGKPHRTTNVITVYGRTFKLIGFRNAVRVTSVMAATVVIGMVIMALAYMGGLLFTIAFLQAFGSQFLFDVLGNPIVSVSVLGVSMVTSASVWLGYFATVQTVLYVDLRMRRE
ncbi:MAG: hypothetical protein L0G99_12290, partial [Propionibacteriales bacterium]|nr:hypothetical protein [Propionibacteriales bacterium]